MGTAISSLKYPFSKNGRPISDPYSSTVDVALNGFCGLQSTFHTNIEAYSNILISMLLGI